MIRFLATADVAVIAFACLVVISDHGASGQPVIESILEAVRPFRGRLRQFPQHHLSNGAVRVYVPGPKDERSG
jgi:hypothetical protein